MLPTVAIVGRPNVGKSSLMNQLVGRLVSIVDPTAGVTRDRVGCEMELPPAKEGGKPRCAELIDTGGYGIYSEEDKNHPLTADVELQIEMAMAQAALILFVVDVQTGLLPLDMQVANLLRKKVGKTKPVIVVVNKVDSPKLDSSAAEAARLGFGEPSIMSATTGRGKYELLERIAGLIDFAKVQPPKPSEMLLAIVGKRNSGKSTLVNALAGEDRVIVSEIAGTTRDSVDVRFEMDGHAFTAIDTAGIRKHKSLEDDIEYYSLHRSLRAIRRADVVILLLDALAEVSQVDQKLMQEINEHYKPCIIVVNKWDLVEGKKTTEDFMDYLTQQLRGLDFAPIAFISAKEADGLKPLVKLAKDMERQSGIRVSTGGLNRIVQDILKTRVPSSGVGTRTKVYYATQTAVRPPTVALFVNDAEAFDQRYERYFMKQFRQRVPFGEVPIKLLIRGKIKDEEE